MFHEMDPPPPHSIRSHSDFIESTTGADVLHPVFTPYTYFHARVSEREGLVLEWGGEAKKNLALGPRVSRASR